MSDWKLPWEGGCRCGRVRLRITAPPVISSACHCTGCQRMTASAFSLTLTVPSASFQVTEGEPAIGGLHGPSRHYYCPHCKSWMFTRPEGMDQFVNVRAPMLDDSRWAEPFVDLFVSEKLPWATTPAKHHFETVPKLEDYAALAAEYAQLGARPG